MPRLTYFAGVALVALAGAFLVTDWLTWEPGVTLANVRRVRPGMTRAHVERLLGSAGGMAVIVRYGPVCPHERTWAGGDCVLFVTYDAHWRVEAAHPIDTRTQAAPTPLGRLWSGGSEAPRE